MSELQPNELSAGIDTSQDTVVPTDRPQSWWAGLTISSMIRLVGAVLLLVSASSFMIEQVSNQNATIRYLALLGHTLFLGIAGLFCALKLKESRSARTFFAIVVASVPVHFAVLGGLFYSTVQWDAMYNVTQPKTWMASSLGQTFALLGAGLAVLLPFTSFAMMSLARKHAKSLSAAFLAINMLLLVPLRYPDTAVWLFIIGVALFVWMERGVFSRQPALKTIEGRILRVILAAPLIVLLGRTALFYDGTIWFYSNALAATAFALHLLLSAKRNTGAGIQIFLSVIAIVGAAISFDEVLPVVALYDNVPPWHVSLFWMFISALMAFLGLFYAGNHSIYFRAAAMVFMVSSLVHMLEATGVLTTAIAFAASAITLFAAIQMRQRITLYLAIATLMFCTLFHLHGMVHLSAVSHWGVLLATGALLLVGASLLERKKDAVLHRIKTARAAIHSWGY